MNSTALLAIPSGELADAVPREEYNRLLQIPRTMALEGEMNELAVHARSWYAKYGKPFSAWREVLVAKIHSPIIELADGVHFHSALLAQRLTTGESQSMILLAASAGTEVAHEVAKYWADRPDQAFFLDRFAVAITEQLIQWSAIALCRQSEASQMTLLPHLSPGCGNWDLQDQHKLMNLLAPGKKDLGPIQLLDSGALRPQYSVMATLGVTRRKFAESPKDICRSCDLSPCAFRRAPFAPFIKTL